jgi:uncharacterized membrane protein
MQNPPPNQPGTSSGIGGLDPKVAAALSYIWIVGLIFFFIEKENRFVRFHAMQSIIFGIANTVIMFVLAILAVILTFAFGIGGAMVGGGIGTLVSMLVWLIWLLFWVIGLALFLGLIFAAVKAYQGQKFKLPVIGNMAEKIVDK